MSIHIIIDGYNLIRQSDRLSRLDRSDIQAGREALLADLVAYKKLKAHRITVVFDGTGAPPFSNQRDNHRGISVAFSRNGETADAVIKRMARKEKEKALVVSSDHDIVNSATGSGAATISAPEFESKLTMAVMMAGGDKENDELSGWKPTTKKKGPSRRLSKRQRRNRVKINKL